MPKLINQSQYTNFISWLKEFANDECGELLNYDDDALCEWLNMLDEKGRIEIPPRLSRQGRPILGDFPELVSNNE